MLALCPEHRKRDQNPKFTPLSETTSIPVCFIYESPPPGKDPHNLEVIKLRTDPGILIRDSAFHFSDTKTLAKTTVTFLFYLPSHYHIYIFKSLCASRDDYFENLGETNVLACKMFTSGCRPWLKNVACLSSLLSTTVFLQSFKRYPLRKSKLAYLSKLCKM